MGDLPFFQTTESMDSFKESKKDRAWLQKSSIADWDWNLAMETKVFFLRNKTEILHPPHSDLKTTEVKWFIEMDVVASTYNPIALKAEAGGCLWVWGQ